MARDKLGVLLRQPGERHERRRHPGAPERLVARAREAPAAALLARDVGHDRLGEALRVLRRVQHGVVGGAARAGRVDVEVQDAALVQLAPCVIRVPGRAGVAAVRVAGPEREPDAPAERVAPAGEQPRHLQHGRVRSPVVHRAVVPRVDVAGEQQEPVLVTPRQLADQMRNRHPARADPRGHPHAHRAARQQRTQALRRRRRAPTGTGPPAPATPCPATACPRSSSRSCCAGDP